MSYDLRFMKMVLIKTPPPPPHLRLQTSNEKNSLYKVKVIEVMLVWKSSLVKSLLLSHELAHVISFLLIMVLLREPRGSKETIYNCQPAQLVRAWGGGWGEGGPSGY